MALRKKKVLFLATSLDTKGGISSLCRVLLDSDFKNLYNIHFIATHIDENSRAKIFYFLRSFVVYLVHLRKTSLVHAHISTPISLMRKLPFIMLAKVFHKKVVVHLHSASEKPLVSIRFNWLYRYVFGHADKVLVLTDSWRTGLAEQLALNVNTFMEFRNVVEVPDENPYSTFNKNILYLAKLNSRKGYEDLLIAFKTVAKEFPEWKLILAGDGELGKAKALIKQLQLENHVTLTGWVGGEAKHDLLKKAGIFCLPSYGEGLPISILESMSYGLPIVCTRVGGIPDIISSKDNFLFVEPSDTKSLSQSLLRAISSDDFRENSSNANYRSITENYNISYAIELLNTLYQTLL